MKQQSQPQEQPIPTPVPAPAEKPQQTAAKSASDGAGKTMSLDEFQKAAMKLKILLDNGIISQAEFDEEKKRLVDSMQL